MSLENIVKLDPVEAGRRGGYATAARMTPEERKEALAQRLGGEAATSAHFSEMAKRGNAQRKAGAEPAERTRRLANVGRLLLASLEAEAEDA